MSRLSKLEKKAEILRGWPNGEAIEMNYQGDSLGNGDIVKITAAGAVKAAAADDTALGLVIRGKNDQYGSNQARTPNTVLLSNFVVRTTNVDTANTPAIGGAVYVNADNALTAVDGGGAVFGTCLEVDASVTDASGVSATAVVVLVK